MNEQTNNKIKEDWETEVNRILYGITHTEIESSFGWWETSKGAEMGIERLKQLKKFITDLLKEKTDIESKRHILIMSEFIKAKGRDYPLGNYLDMLLELDKIKEDK